ncbi:MAG TPA: hypothetical protein PKH65_09125 [Bacteroidia bacterium]|nr:hypothetical protein [Bacteroidia bacterium]
MKKILFTMHCFFLCIFVSTISFAQNQSGKTSDEGNITPYRTFNNYSSPPPSGFAPIQINTDEAQIEQTNNKAEAQYTAEYINLENLRNLLDNPDAIGLRIYNVIDAYKNGAGRVMVVPVRSDGSEIFYASKITYIMSESFMGSRITCKKLWRSNARSYYQYVDVAKRQSAFISKQDIENIINPSGTIGIKFIPGSRLYTDSINYNQKRLAFLMIGVSDNDGTLNDVGTTYHKINEPCPTYCPKLGTLLVD